MSGRTARSSPRNPEEPVIRDSLDGEELIGAKQNRIVNLTVLVAAGQTLHIPVSCVEAGRSGPPLARVRRGRPRPLRVGGASREDHAGRARKLQEVSYCMRTSGSRMADQGGVWDEIDVKARRMKAESATYAAAETYDRSGEAAAAPAAANPTGTTPAEPAKASSAAKAPHPARFLAALTRTAAERFPAIGLGEGGRLCVSHRTSSQAGWRSPSRCPFHP
jgi:hypothetical protein